MKLKPLNPDEENVIVLKGTERPFSGKYENFHTPGAYTCRRCGAYLFRSQDKFDSGCGWPSFDDEVLGAVSRIADADGVRTEIVCARCDAHLGHVFLGEAMTSKNTRHCVNSVSLDFIPQDKTVDTKETACFGGGCFWCTEAVFSMVKGVLSVTSGYAGGHIDHPRYEEVCQGDTGHAEAIQVEFNPAIISYEAMLEIFFMTHDPTSLNQQGADQGTQYRSVIFYADDLQREIAQTMIRRFTTQGFFSRPIVTKIEPLKEFYPAEDYHQKYFFQNPGARYCQTVISPKITKFKEYYKNYLK